MANSYVSRKIFHLADDVFIGKFTAHGGIQFDRFFSGPAFSRGVVSRPMFNGAVVISVEPCFTVNSDRMELKISLRAVENT
jgi:hypothetical protein